MRVRCGKRVGKTGHVEQHLEKLLKRQGGTAALQASIRYPDRSGSLCRHLAAINHSIHMLRIDIEHMQPLRVTPIVPLK